MNEFTTEHHRLRSSIQPPHPFPLANLIHKLSPFLNGNIQHPRYRECLGDDIQYFSRIHGSTYA